MLRNEVEITKRTSSFVIIDIADILYSRRWKGRCSTGKAVEVAIVVDDEHRRQWPNADCECAPP